MEFILLGALIWLCKSAAEDVMHAKNGTPNPRYEMKRAKAAAAGKRYEQPRYGSRDYFGDLWSDFLGKRTELRREKAAEKAAEKQRAAEVSIDMPVVEPVAKPEPRRTPDGRDREARYEPTTRPDAGGADPAPAPPAGKPAPTQTRPLAIVIPFDRKETTSKEDPMTAPTTETVEIIGLDQAIAYATNLATRAAQHGQAGNEGYIGSLTTAKVTGAGLASAHEMQEAFTNAAVAAERHKAELEKQKTVQEAYDNAPDAGNQEFVQAGR